jgi:hypothetical protein
MIADHLEITKFAHEIDEQINARRAAATAAVAAAASAAAENSTEAMAVQRCWLEAHQSFQRAIVASSAPPPSPLRGVWEWLKERDPDAEYDLPAFGTWAKYLRAYDHAVKGRKNESRRGRAGRSTAAPDEL